MDSEIKNRIKEYYAFWLGANRLYEEWAKKRGLSSDALFTLYAIWEGGPGCTQKKICEKWLMPKQTVNTILKIFEKKGYITLHVLQTDKRNKEILLTDTGKEYANNIILSLYSLEESVMEKMGPKNREDMARNNTLFMNLLKEKIQGENRC